MKVKTLSVLAGLGGSLLLGSAAQAGFTGLVIETKDASSQLPALDLFVCNIYMQFSDPLDRGYAVAGTPGSPLSIGLVGSGSFYENAFGGVTAPSAAFIPLFPSLAFDSFVTINTKTTADGAPPSLSPGFPTGATALLGGLSGSNIGWFVTPTDALAVPDANGQVLIAQLSVDQLTNPNASGIAGSFNVQWDDANGNTTLQAVSFEHLIPAPGALALLGVAGLMGSRRRRR